MRKGKGRPDITEVMFYPGYPSGSNSSFDSLINLNVFLLIGWGGGAGRAGGGGEGGREYKYRETKVIVYTKFNVQYIGNCIRICNERGVSRIILIC
jgi:hypothetical protein